MAKGEKQKQKKRKKLAAGFVRQALPSPARPAGSLFRIVPATTAVALLLLGMKTIEIVKDGKQVSDELFYSTVQAATEEPSEEKKEDKKEDTKEGEEKTESGEHGEGGEHGGSEEGGEGEHGGGKKDAIPVCKPVDFTERRNKNYNERELDVLQALSERRQKLDDREKEINLRENVLTASEKRIDLKIADMQALSTQIKGLLIAYDKQEDSKINSLVKVYETMKPKDAARIFEEMDMPILLEVVSRMKEMRVAPVLANMSAQKAKELTEELAAQRKLSKPVTDAGENAVTETPAAPVPDSTAAPAPAAPENTTTPAPAPAAPEASPPATSAPTPAPAAPAGG